MYKDSPLALNECVVSERLLGGPSTVWPQAFLLLASESKRETQKEANAKIKCCVVFEVE